MSLSPHLELDLCVRDWATKVIVRGNGGLNGITQSHRLRRSFDRHLVLGLLILLNPEIQGSKLKLFALRPPEGVGEILGPNTKLVLSESGVFGQSPAITELAVGSRCDFPVEDGLAPGVDQAHHEVAGGIV